jgi:signal transduction histidine kinase
MNAVRHGHARRVEMDIAFDDEVLRLRVSDDGGGFNDHDSEPSAATAHYGLLSMKERAIEAGGSCSVESRPGTGVEVVAEFPLAPTG